MSLLTDMYIASSAKNVKNKFLKREKNYVALIYEKYKIDTTRFDESNTYYTSKIDEYSDVLKLVKKNIDSMYDVYEEELMLKDSTKFNKERLKEERLPEKLLKKNSKLIKTLELKKKKKQI